jgi:hypothetical protein
MMAEELVFLWLPNQIQLESRTIDWNYIHTRKRLNPKLSVDLYSIAWKTWK